jgi:hypothetical protein
VTPDAPLLLKNALPMDRLLIQTIRIRRRFWRVNIESQRIELLVTEPSAIFRKTIGYRRRLKIAVVRRDVESVVHDCITHQIAYGTVARQSGRIQDLISCSPINDGTLEGDRSVVPCLACTPGCMAAFRRAYSSILIDSNSSRFTTHGAPNRVHRPLIARAASAAKIWPKGRLPCENNGSTE